MWEIVLASGPDPQDGAPTPPPPPSGSESPHPPEDPFEMPPGLRTAVLFLLGFALTVAQAVAYIAYGQEPNYLLASIAVACLGLPLFLNTPGGKGG